jgi:hypothetical protein
MFRRTLRFVIFAITVALAPIAPGASAQPAFVVEDVMVDETATTASEARDRALAQGQAMAWERLVARIVPRAQRARVPRLSANRVADLVESFELVTERRSAVRYLATLTYYFRAADVRAELRRANVAFAETVARPLVILPVLIDPAGTKLWEEDNAWRHAWAALPESDGLLALIVPPGDLADIGEVDASQALAGDEDAMLRLAARHGAVGALVVAATPNDDGRTLSVSSTRYDANDSETHVDSHEARPGEPIEALLSRVALAMRDGAVEHWKEEQVLNFEELRRLSVDVPLADLSGWIMIRSRLAEIASIQDVDVVSLSRRQAVIDLGFLGDVARLRQALAQKDLRLIEAEGGWRLALTSARASGRPSP